MSDDDIDFEIDITSKAIIGLICLGAAVLWSVVCLGIYSIVSHL